VKSIFYDIGFYCWRLFPVNVSVTKLHFQIPTSTILSNLGCMGRTATEKNKQINLADNNVCQGDMGDN
jgi:hypothetical protein